VRPGWTGRGTPRRRSSGRRRASRPGPQGIGADSRERRNGLYLQAHEVAGLAGISKNTLLRWLKAGKVPEVARDRNGWRIFSEEDVARIRAYAGKITPPEVYARDATGAENANGEAA